jgi:long-chain fatty acid transport protein
MEKAALLRRRLVSRALACFPIVLGSLMFCVSERTAQASGFALREQSAVGLSNAFAGATAAGEDLSYMFYNPASMARHSGNQMIAVASYIMPRMSFENVQARTALGTPVAGGSGGDDATPNAFVPAAYAMWEVAPDWRVGLGLNVPFGLETEYNDGWAGRYHAIRSRLRTVSVAPTVAWRVTDVVSIGASLQIEYVDALLTNAIDFGTLGASARIPGAVPAQQDGFADLEGDDIGVGFALGLLAEPWKGTRFGIGYRSHIEREITGDARFVLDGAGIGAQLASARGAFTDTGLEADVTTPESVSVGAYHDINDNWSVMGEVAWTHWSRFKELRIRFDNPAQPDNVTEEDWRDTMFVAAGVTFRPNNHWSLRAGVAFDQSPVPNRTRTPRIPDNDRLWVSFGLTYAPFANLEFGFGYTHIFLDDSTSQLLATAPGNAARGDFRGSLESSIDLLSAQVLWRF